MWIHQWNVRNDWTLQSSSTTTPVGVALKKNFTNYPRKRTFVTIVLPKTKLDIRHDYNKFYVCHKKAKLAGDICVFKTDSIKNDLIRSRYITILAHYHAFWLLRFFVVPSAWRHWLMSRDKKRSGFTITWPGDEWAWWLITVSLIKPDELQRLYSTLKKLFNA